MITGKRLAAIAKLSLPVTIALSSTLMEPLASLAMIGTLGNNAIGAVGLSFACNTFILAFVGGFTPTVQRLVARKRGEASMESTLLPLGGGLWVALAIGLLLTIICYLVSPALFSLLCPDPNVTRIG